MEKRAFIVVFTMLAVLSLLVHLGFTPSAYLSVQLPARIFTFILMGLALALAVYMMLHKQDARALEAAADPAQFIRGKAGDLMRTGRFIVRHRKVDAAGRIVDGFPELVTISGSMRFRDDIAAAAESETIKGNIALLPCLTADLNMRQVATDYASIIIYQSGEEGLKRLLDEIHFRRIDISDRLHVVNVRGYIGDSTAEEIKYARKLGVKITFQFPELAGQDAELIERFEAAKD